MSVPTARIVKSFIAASLAAAAFAAESRAQFGPIVSGPGGNPTGAPQFFPIPEGPAPGHFRFASPSNRAVVHYATGAGSFEKWLVPEPDQDQDGDSDINDLGIFFGNLHTLSEFLTIGAGPQWTDWHEEILTPDWVWNAPNIMLDTPSNPGVLNNLTITPSGQRVDFYFDPLPVGTDINIRKELMFTGAVTPQMANDFFAGEYKIRIAEYPTSELIPEPTSASICLLGLAAAAGRRRWRNG